jgi:hypothetical protein
VPVKRLVQGVPLDQAVNIGVVDDPSLLDYYVQLGARVRAGASDLSLLQDRGGIFKPAGT